MKKENGNNGHFKHRLKSIPDFTTQQWCSDDEDYGSRGKGCVELVANAKLPTRYGEFTIVGFFDTETKKEHTAIVKGDISGKEACPLRIHSECHTGDIFCSLRCDCREQLEESLRYISKKPFGSIVYLKQEGRGIGLVNKIKAYGLQDLGLDTIEANEYLGFPEDLRDYSVAAKIIKLLDINSIALLTNNPDKIKGLQAEGIRVVERIPLVTKPNNYNRHYLTTKSEKMGHLF